MPTRNVLFVDLVEPFNQNFRLLQEMLELGDLVCDFLLKNLFHLLLIDPVLLIMIAIEDLQTLLAFRRTNAASIRKFLRDSCLSLFDLLSPFVKSSWDRGIHHKEVVPQPDLGVRRNRSRQLANTCRGFPGSMMVRTLRLLGLAV